MLGGQRDSQEATSLKSGAVLSWEGGEVWAGGVGF